MAKMDWRRARKRECDYGPAADDYTDPKVKRAEQRDGAALRELMRGLKISGQVNLDMAKEKREVRRRSNVAECPRGLV